MTGARDPAQRVRHPAGGSVRGLHTWARHRIGPLLLSAQAAAVPLLPGLAAAGFFVRLGLRWRDARLDWLPLWAPFLLPIALQAVAGGWQTAAMLTAQVAFGAALSTVAKLPEPSILLGGAVALLVLAGLVSVDRWHSARSWYALAASAVQPIGIGVSGGIDRVHGGGIDRAARTWDLDGPVSGITGSLTLRWARPLPSADRSTTERAGAEPAAEPAGASEAERASEPAAEPGAGVELHALVPAIDRTHRLVLPLLVEPDWTDQPYAFEHQALAAAPFVQLRLSVPEGAAIEVRSTTLAAAGAARVSARPLPTRPRARLWFEHFNLLGHSAAMWTVVVATVAARRRAHARYLLVLFAGVVVTVASGSRAATLAILVAVAMHAVALLLARAQAQTHSKAQAQARQPQPGTQERSRTPAPAPPQASAPPQAQPQAPPQPSAPAHPVAPSRWIRRLFVGAALLVAAIGLTLTFAMRPVEGFGPSRLSLWSVAVAALREHPLAGSPVPFEVAVAEALPELEAGVATHAHNLWLDAGYRYGVPGALAMALFVGGVAWFVYRRSAWYGLAVVVPLVALQAFDVTLWYPGVLIALLIGANLDPEAA